MVTRSTRTARSYSELRIALQPGDPRSVGGAEQFAVHVTSPDGATLDQMFVNPITSRQLTAALATTPPATKALQRSVAVESLDPLRDIGTRLFDALFQGSLWRLYESLRLRDDPMRLRIVTQAEASGIPWELLYDPHREDFLVLSTRSPLVRQAYQVAAPEMLEPLRPPVRVLVVIADVTNVLQGDREVTSIRKADHGGLLEVEVMDGDDATIDRVAAALRSDVHILHFIGHGVELAEAPSASRVARQAIALAKSSAARPPTSSDISPADGAVDYVEPKGLQRLLGSSGVRLVVLNASSTDGYAARLAEVVPAAIGVRGQITDLAAIAFSEGLYAALLDGNPLEAAVTSGRLTIDSHEPGGREWSAPVFYLQAASGEFVSSPDRASARPVTPPAEIGGVEADLGVESRVAESLLKVHEANLSALQRQRDELGADAPSFLVEQVEATANEVDRLRRELTGDERQTDA